MRHDNSSTDEEEKESIDYEATKEMVNLVVRAPLRHPKLSAAIFLVLTALGIVAAFFVTPMYQASEVLVITRNVLTPTIGQQQNGPPQDYDPSAGVWEAVKGRDSLIKLAQQVHLADRLRLASDQPLTEEAKLQVAVKLLDDRFQIKGDGNTVSFITQWTDAQTAYDLAKGSVLNFLETRKGDEIAKISEAINLLEKSAKEEREGIDQALQDFMKLKTGWSGKSNLAPAVSGAVAAAPAPAYRPPAAATVGPDVDLAKRLEDKKQQIKQTEDEWHRAQTEAAARLNELLLKFTPSHPSVIAQQTQIERLAEEPANLKALKNEERSLIRELETQMGAKIAAAPTGGNSAPVIIPQLSSLGTPRTMSKQDLEVADPASAVALDGLQSRVRKFNDYSDQIRDKRLQLELARKAFESRYRTFKPAEMPSKPKMPMRVLLVWGGALLGLFLSIGVAAALDLASGRFIEPWQVKRRLALPVLGEVAGP